MRVVAAVLTHNAKRYGRDMLLRDTLRSLAEADRVLLVDNGSSDGMADWVAQVGGFCYQPADRVTTCGRGMNVTITMAAADADVVVFSNDDIVWRPGWRARVQSFWEHAPDDVAIMSGLLEPDFPWNQPRATVEYGGVRGLVRETVPGGAWTLMAANWSIIGPVPEKAGWDDVPTCRRMNQLGWRNVAVDLADHAGVELSTWGNGSQKFAKPLNREAWGL